MGHFNYDVIRLIRSIVIKNKIHRCNKSYHERYKIVTVGNNEIYTVKQPYQSAEVFNYRDMSDGSNFYIFKIGDPLAYIVYDLPENY